MEQKFFSENLCSRRWGSSLTICARLTVRSYPHQHEQKFSGAHVCRVTLKPLDNFSKYPPFPPNIIVRGVGGVPELFFLLESYYFCYLGAHAKFQNPTTTPSGQISNEPEERERRRREREKKCPL
jgi:hypothetical protein